MNDDALNALTEYGQAIRGDWGRIDGRWVRDDINRIVGWIRTPDTAPALTEMRHTLDICTSGGGHWSDYCAPDCPEVPV